MQAKKLKFSDITSNYSPWTLYFLIVSMFGVTGWYADLFKRFMPDWLAVGILILPVAIVVLIQWGDAPSKTAARAHLSAASVFTTLSVGMELGRFFHHHPEGELFFKVLAHLGWLFAWGAIFKKARRFGKPHRNE